MEYKEFKTILERADYHCTWKSRTKTTCCYEYTCDDPIPGAYGRFMFIVAVDRNRMGRVDMCWPSDITGITIDPEDIRCYVKKNPATEPKTRKVADVHEGRLHLVVIWHRNECSFPYHVYRLGYELKTDPDGIGRYYDTKHLLHKFNTLGLALEYVTQKVWEN